MAYKHQIPRNESDADKATRWARENENKRAGGRTGNPFATLCENCYGRRPAPCDDECPHPKFVRSAK